MPKYKYLVPLYTPSSMRSICVGLVDPEGMEPTGDP